MKVRCYKCSADMEFPYMKCDKCGWEPDGKKKERALKFAKRYIENNGDDPELAIILENAIGIERAYPDWRASYEPGNELKVKCYRCHKPMEFPYLECTECGWIARKEMRKRARVLSEMYIDQHKDREESLRIIWDEENRRLKKR